jgi:DUF4097 and DUF4098 domain-containing protein YvlB
VRVAGELGQEVERLELESQGSRTLLRVVLRNDRRGSRRGDWDDDTDLRVQAPRAMALRLSTVSADVAIRGMEGEQQVSGVSGDIEIQAFSSEIRVQSVSGDVGITGNGEPQYTRASSVSGDVSLRGLSGEILAESVSGDVDVFDARLDRAEMKSVSGDLRFAGTLSGSARLDAIATSGDIDLQFAEDTPGNYRLSTFSGNIDNCFGPRPAADPPGRSSQELRFDHGTANRQIQARTHSGDVGVCASGR